MATEPREEPEGDRHFWQQVAAATEGTIDPPKDGWQRISRRLDAEMRPTEIEPPVPPAGGGLRLPGLLVWFVGLFALIALFMITANTRPVPVENVPARVDPIGAPPVDTGTRQMQVAYEGAVSASVKDPRMRLDFRITNVGTGPIRIPGPGGPTSASPHFLLDVQQSGAQILQMHLVAESADLRLADGTMPAVADPALDLTLVPGESVLAHVTGEVARVFPHGPGLYQVRVRYLPPGLSEKTSPPDTISAPIDVRVGK
ncbi:MAG TPA: hypothetical protein VL860_14680 [Planctomycetota bacterium]|nr:hypothetical protein [Planctomycetota bacterium]